jgi:hypothetical protein
MKLEKAYAHVRFGALILMASYFFITVSCLFFAPRFERDPSQHNNTAALKRSTQLIYTLIRTNRCPSNDSKKVKTFARNCSASFISLLARPQPLQAVANSRDHISQFLSNHHYSYLSNRILRV